MIDRHYGHIVAIASNCGLFGLSHLGDYCASKFAIIGYMECVEDEIFRSKCSGVNTTIVILGPLKGGLNKRVTEIVIPDSVNFLPANVCAERIVQGVITNQKFLYIPKSYRLLEFVKRYRDNSLFPIKSKFLFFSFLPYDAFKAILSYVLNVHDPNLKRNRQRKPARL
jgi:short-subunit dehydrogenase